LELCLRLDLVLIRARRFSNKVQNTWQLKLRNAMHCQSESVCHQGNREKKYHVTYWMRQAAKMGEI
jgi:hypothetical protein